MTTLEWHYDFKLKIDKVDSLSKDDFHPAEIDWLLNESVEVFMKQRYGLTNNVSKGFEVTQKRIDDLKTLVIKSPSSIQPALPVVLIDTKHGMYEAKLGDLEFNYYFLIRAEASISKSDCTKCVGVTNVQHDDLTAALNDSFQKPNFEWGEVVAVFGKETQPISNKGSLYLYSNGEFVIDNVYIEYLKEPTRISVAGYTRMDGSPSLAVQSDMPDHTHREIVDLAVQIASGIIESPEYVQFKQLKLATQE